MTRRTDRLGSVIKEEITQLLMKGRLKDPRIHEMTTITGVRVTRDLSIATIYFSVLGEEADIEATGQGLEAASGFIQRHLARHMRIRVIPRVRFEYDPSIVYGDKMSRILSELPEIKEGHGEQQNDQANPSEDVSDDEDTSSR